MKRDISILDIHISNLEQKDIEDYLKIEFDAFYDKLKVMFSNKKDAALNITRAEISNNIDNGRYYIAKAGKKAVGIMEIITKENTRTYKTSFRVYINYLGFFKGIKAIFFNLIEVPKLKKDTIYIDTVAVDADNRGQGIAIKMLSFIEGYAKKYRKKILTLWVAASNKNAYKLYRKFGFCDVIMRSSGLAEKLSGYRDWIYMKKEI